MKALRKDFFMEIRKSKARFISIFFIVAMGVAFFSGIQAASPDMRFSGDAYYDESALMDIKVMGTLGLTEEDVEAVKAIKGVQDAEGSFSTDVICGDEESQKVLHIESLNETVNKLTATEGRLPEERGEIFLDRTFAKGQGYKVGDTISLRQETDSELLLGETYTVVGVGNSPLYISFNRGNTTLGTGEINGFAYVMPQDFDQEVYTQIYVRVHGAEALTSYTDAYDTLIDKIKERVEGIEEERCQIRYDDIRGEAEEQLEEARQELSDGKKEASKELSDAKKKLEDGQKEHEDGKKEYEDGIEQLENAKQELSDGWAQIASAKQELESGRAELDSARAQAANGQSQLDSAQAELTSGMETLEAKQAELDQGKAELAAAEEQLEAGMAKIQESKNLLAEKQAELDDGKAAAAAGREEIAASRTQLQGQREQCVSGLAQVEAGEAQIPAGEAALAQAREELAGLNAQLGALQEELASLKESGTATPEEIEAKEAEVGQLEGTVSAYQAETDAQEAALTETKNQLAAQRSQLEESLAQIDAGLETLNQKEAELSRQESLFAPAQEEIDAGYAAINEEEQKLAPAQQEIADNKEVLNAGQAELDKALEELNAGQAQINANAQTVAAAWEQIAAGEARLASGEEEIRQNEQKLVSGQQEIEENEKKLADAKTELADAKKDLKDGWEEYEKGKKEAQEEIADGEQKLADAQEEIDALERPQWMVTDRHDLPEYSDYGDNADRIRNIGQVFPVIFFLVAALVSLTTMTRMVEEQRTQIGTMKALGYGKYAIVSKYLNYAFLATVGGSVFGVLIGEKILPYIIIKAYGIMYHSMASSLEIHYEWKFAMIASAAAVVCTIGATVFSCYRALAETPASLMRPPAPKEGKRVLVERMTFLWKHLSFTWKSTLRNLFRYKKRLFMTVFGIAGSMALMLVGFGIRDSILDIGTRQYEELQHYDAMIIDDDEATEEERRELEDFLSGSPEIARYTYIQLGSMTAPRDRSNISVYVYVPENLETFREDVTLQDRRTKERYELTDEGAVISEKTATLTGLGEGDMLTLTKDNEDYTVKIARITENYMGHYIYMTPGVYEQTFGEKPDYTSIVFTMKEEYRDSAEELGNEILKYPAALSISYTSSLEGQLERMLGTLGMVIVVLIVSAGMLAFVVLYNLNNINITERQRELATLKVLGFFDTEVSNYVFRENVLLTLIGVLAGAVFGIFLHRYVITTVEVDAVMFGRNIKAASFLYSGMFTIGFSMIVNAFMHFKLKRIDMVESLKSVE